MIDKDKFLGKWKLKSMKNVAANSNEFHPFGKYVEGLLIYEKDYIAVQLASLERNSFNSDDFRKGSKNEIFEAFNQYIAYYGSYEIIEDKQLIIHNVELSMYPNWIGTKQKRYYSFENNSLVLKAHPVIFEDMEYTPTLIWEKIT